VFSSADDAARFTDWMAARNPWQAEFAGPRVELLPGDDEAEFGSTLEVILKEAAAPAPRVWLVSPAPWSRGGVADVARQVLLSPLSRCWRMTAVPTYVTGSAALRLWWALRGTVSSTLGLLFRKPDLVHLKVASRGSFVRKFLVTALCRLRGVPVLVHIHGGGFDRFVSTSPAPVRGAARWMVERAPLVLSLSERWADKLRPLFPRARIEAIPNPVETHRYDDIAENRYAAGTPESDSPRALFLGDVLERKGVFDLLQAWPAVIAKCPGARLSLAGTGELERARRECESAGISDRVEVLGWVGFEDKYELFRRAALFVLPSYIEGVPISLLEAMAAGLPSVVTPVGGVLDAVRPDRDALVVPPGDRAALSEAVLRLFQDRELARRLGLSCRERVRAMDVGPYAARLDGYYREILGSPVEQESDLVPQEKREAS
jgi:glycosyltransferase involved in cell wall biosynthesis